jgi:hypothetical protein
LGVPLPRTAAQAAQLALPSLAWYLPAGQGTQWEGDELPALALKVPAGQGAQTLLELAPEVLENLPAPQRVQLKSNGAAHAPKRQHTAAPGALVVPGAHGWHAALPLVLENVLAPQGSQPLVGEAKVPTGHVEHEVLPMPNVEAPRGQGVQKGAPEAFEKLPSGQ